MSTFEHYTWLPHLRNVAYTRAETITERAIWLVFRKAILSAFLHKITQSETGHAMTDLTCSKRSSNFDM